ncbi:MAG: hypothetical protein HOM58_14510 [Rhodospirillaceae bacterium]|jgi:hypothetical protein|nr:hypothetical protein [Rhodospirillaceae bacterium]MBT5459469.1 hypothetical protein [Rhodospirillaceae bacterium]
MAGESKGDVLIEIWQVGNAVKVSAIDVATGTEVSIVGSPSTSEETLKRTAVNKLNYVLRKEAANSGKAGGSGIMI